MTEATLSAVVWREHAAYVSVCPELGVASQGSTVAEAVAQLHEAVDLYLENAEALGMMEDVKAILESPDRLSTTINVTLPWAS